MLHEQIDGRDRLTCFWLCIVSVRSCTIERPTFVNASVAASAPSDGDLMLRVHFKLRRLEIIVMCLGDDVSVSRSVTSWSSNLWCHYFLRRFLEVQCIHGSDIVSKPWEAISRWILKLKMSGEVHVSVSYSRPRGKRGIRSAVNKEMKMWAVFQLKRSSKSLPKTDTWRVVGIRRGRSPYHCIVDMFSG